MHDTTIRFDDGAACEQMMGRWSLWLASPFLDWIAAPKKTALAQASEDAMVVGTMGGRVLVRWDETSRPGDDAALGPLVPSGVERAAGHVPLSRVGDPKDFADMTLVLVSLQAGYVAGLVVGADGGLAMGPPWRNPLLAPVRHSVPMVSAAEPAPAPPQSTGLPRRARVQPVRRAAHAP